MHCGFSHLIVDIIDVNLQICGLPALRRDGDIDDNVDDKGDIDATTEESLEKLCPQENLEGSDGSNLQARCSLSFLDDK